MRGRHLFVVPIVAGLTLMIPPPTSVGETPNQKRIDKLIEQLGSSNFAEREKASRELAAIGVPALDALRQATKSEDAEVRKRAEEILPRIERQAESMRVLAPTRVHLIYKDTPLGEAVADFQKKSGYRIQLHDPDGKLRERKLTLDTGETTFWHAFVLFCDKAELSEMSMEELLRVPQPPGVQAVIRPGRSFMPGRNGQLILKDGKAKKLSTDDRCAVRVRALGKSDLFGNVPQGEIILALEVSLEPKLQWQMFQSIHVEKAVDNRDQKLTQVIPQVEGAAGIVGGNLAGGVVILQQRQMQMQMQMQMMVRQKMGWSGLSQIVPVQFKKGVKEAQALKELSGTLTVQLLTAAQPLIAADKLDKSAGKTFKGDKGGSIKIVSVQAEEDQTTIQLEFEQPPYDKVAPVQSHVILGDGIRDGAQLAGVKASIRDGFMESFNGLSVQDNKGNALPIKVATAAPVQRQPGPGFGPIMSYVFLCRHEKDKGQPAKVVYLGRKRATVEIPFVLKDVPLP